MNTFSSTTSADKATVATFYEKRISKFSLNAAELPKLDAEFEEITEGAELTKKEKLKTKWAELEALAIRISLLAADLGAHFEKRVEAIPRAAIDSLWLRNLPTPQQTTGSCSALTKLDGLVATKQRAMPGCFSTAVSTG